MHITGNFGRFFEPKLEESSSQENDLNATNLLSKHVFCCNEYEATILMDQSWCAMRAIRKKKQEQTRTWANAQRDGRPAEQVAPSVQRRKVWLTLATWLPCSNAAKTRNPLKLAGVSQTPEPISAVSGPTFTTLWDHLQDILLLNKFFSDCRYVPQLRRYSPTKLCDGAQTATFGECFVSCILASRMQHISDLHSKFALKPHQTDRR